MKFPSPEFDNAVAAACHGTIGDERLSQLHELLRTDADARDEYLWRVEVHGELASGELDFQNLPPCEEPDIKLEAPPKRASVANRDWKQLYPSTVGTVAILVTIVLGGGLWVWHGTSQTPPDEPEIVAQFAELQNCRWMVHATHVRSGDAIQNKQRIELSSGSAEVLFNSGASVTILGPTIFETRSSNSAFLMQGQVRLVADSPESKGFALLTPTSEFVDIGTAFTARVTPDGLSCLSVTEGEVDVVLAGANSTPRLRAGETLFVEPGERQIMTRIEEGDGSAAFRFPTIQPPSSDDFADQSLGNAKVRVVRGELRLRHGVSSSGPASLLLDGAGQSSPNAPLESVFFRDHTSGAFLVDLGRMVSISRINTYSWHQHHTIETHRHRAQQRFTLYGYPDDALPDFSRPPEETGWTRIARVHSDEFFNVNEPLDRPAQQASSITAAQGEVGRFRYLLWDVKHHTFFGELDILRSP